MKSGVTPAVIRAPSRATSVNVARCSEAAVVFRTLGLYRGIWRYASLNDLFGLVRAVTLVVLILVPLLFLLTRAESLPRSVPVIEWGVLQQEATQLLRSIEATARALSGPGSMLFCPAWPITDRWRCHRC